ncbi:hypothetical protein QBC34DRAFT_417139 [Podospora aff. communis PSN243]|uniref:Uncharacterized protein n=1 Tax=Podospora aff. communis PSN243 TaxID=3040156 RepID=A0AAV9G6I5_9PEZI|nr:hypothetical protein QBC34DRAFT_417139 [Podospora aff. communis PSN243]
MLVNIRRSTPHTIRREYLADNHQRPRGHERLWASTSAAMVTRTTTTTTRRTSNLSTARLQLTMNSSVCPTHQPSELFDPTTFRIFGPWSSKSITRGSTFAVERACTASEAACAKSAMFLGASPGSSHSTCPATFASAATATLAPNCRTKLIIASVNTTKRLLLLWRGGRGGKRWRETKGTRPGSLKLITQRKVEYLWRGAFRPGFVCEALTKSRW